MRPWAAWGLAAAVIGSMGLVWFPNGWGPVISLVVLGSYSIFFIAAVFWARASWLVPLVWHGPRQENKVALTFDDGPDPLATPALLELLERRKALATFFCVGRKVLEHPDLVRQMKIQGHQVANHAMNHYWWHNFLTGRGLERELAGAQSAISQAAGVIPLWHRPPMGQKNPHLSSVLTRLGLRCATWDVHSYDRLFGPRRVLRRVKRDIRTGSIILLHDGGAEPQALLYIVSGLLDELQARSLEPVTLADMMGAEAYSDKASDELQRINRGEG